MAGKGKNEQKSAEVGCTLGRFGQLQMMGSVRNGFSMDWGPVRFTKANVLPSQQPQTYILSMHVEVRVNL